MSHINSINNSNTTSLGLSGVNESLLGGGGGGQTFVGGGGGARGRDCNDFFSPITFIV